MNRQSPSFFVVMSGAPGSGKSTLATALADRLSLPLIAYDVIKEALADALGVGDDKWKQRLSQAAGDVFFAVAPPARRAVLDHWWKVPGRQRLLSFDTPMVEVFCRCSDENLIARATERAVGLARHPVHGDWLPEDVIGRWVGIPGALVPLDIGVPILQVCTDAPVAVDAVAEWVEAQRTAHG